MRNKVIIVGNLTENPARFATPSGKSYARFTVAVNDKRGETEQAVFFRCTAWEKMGDTAMNYLHKGDMVEVYGSVTASAYTDKKTGEARASLEVNVRELDFLKFAHKAEDSETPAPSPKPAPVAVPDGDLPF